MGKAGRAVGTGASRVPGLEEGGKERGARAAGAQGAGGSGSGLVSRPVDAGVGTIQGVTGRH